VASVDRPSAPRLSPPLYLLLPVGYMAFIYLLSSIPGTVPVEHGTVTALFAWLPPQIQNVLHIPLFGGLGYLWSWSLRSWRPRARVIALVAFVLTVAYGAFDEWHQLSVPGRYASLTDLSLDAVGAAIGVCFHQLVTWRRYHST
jgi:hypothetical protein